jgi:hypothetical protein
MDQPPRPEPRTGEPAAPDAGSEPGKVRGRPIDDPGASPVERPLWDGPTAPEPDAPPLGAQEAAGSDTIRDGTVRGSSAPPWSSQGQGQGG